MNIICLQNDCDPSALQECFSFECILCLVLFYFCQKTSMSFPPCPLIRTQSSSNLLVIVPKMDTCRLNWNADFKFWGNKFLENLRIGDVHLWFISVQVEANFENTILLLQLLHLRHSDQLKLLRNNKRCSARGQAKKIWNSLRVKKYIEAKTLVVLLVIYVQLKLM